MKEFTTIDEQINILKERNLLFHDVEKAKRNLMQYGYYEIINGYKDCLLEDVSSEIFKSGSTFEHLFALYEFDKNIKNEIFNACLEFEQVLKAAMSYVIAEQFGVTEEKYLNKKNYKSGKPKKDNKKELLILITTLINLIIAVISLIKELLKQ